MAIVQERLRKIQEAMVRQQERIAAAKASLHRLFFALYVRGSIAVLAGSVLTIMRGSGHS